MLRSLLVASALLFSLVLSASAETSLAPAAGTPVLRVEGAITHTNGGGAAQFDHALLDSLPQYKLVTTTPWNEGKVTFQGVLARDLMRAVGATGEKVVGHALNDYQAEIPVQDFETYDVLLAYRADGQIMTARNKGPIFVVYPFDQHPELRRDEILTRSVWQLSRLTVVERP